MEKQKDIVRWESESRKCLQIIEGQFSDQCFEAAKKYYEKYTSLQKKATDLWELHREESNFFDQYSEITKEEQKNTSVFLAKIDRLEKQYLNDVRNKAPQTNCRFLNRPISEYVIGEEYNVNIKKIANIYRNIVLNLFE